MFEEHDIVALTHDLVENKLSAGTLGTIIQVSNDCKSYEVEFVNSKGETACILSLSLSDLRLVWAIAFDKAEFVVRSTSHVNSEDFFWTGEVKIDRNKKIKDFTHHYFA